MKYLTFSVNLSLPKDSLPKVEWILPCLSVLNSNLPLAISFTIESKSSQTVPVFGLGIRPFGPRTLAILPNCLIIAGLATHTSKSRETSPLAI
jgi:hypothetical protein